MALQLVSARAGSFTLYEIEDNLQALIDSVEAAEEPASREAILEEIGQTLRQTKVKRDAVVCFPAALRNAEAVCG